MSTGIRSAIIMAASVTSMVAASGRADAGFVTYSVNLTFDAGGSPFTANGVNGPISGAGTIQGTFTVDSSTSTIEAVSIVAQTSTTLIANFNLGPGYSGLGFGYNGGYTDASFSEPGYETPDFEALFFYPGGSQVFTGDDVFGSKIEFYNGQGQRIAEDQLSGTILQATASVPEPASWAMLLSALCGIGATMAVKGRRGDGRPSADRTHLGLADRFRAHPRQVFLGM